MGRALMIQGCSSNAGKSYLSAGLCRYYANRGYRVAPFKGQNMSNNAGVTPDGLELGRAQLLQAQAARVTPDVRMNPVLLKPEGVDRSQVVVLGRADLELSRLSWTERKRLMWRPVQESLHGLLAEYDLVVIEGAGSPAEINLKEGDIVNMRVAAEANATVLLAADIDRGGAFAHLLGTWHCLEQHERNLIHGFILNKFRGDARLLDNGLQWLERRTGIPTLGVVPYLELPLPDEDAYSLQPTPQTSGAAPVIAIVHTPAISNFDEFDALVHEPGIAVRWARKASDLEGASAVILPGSKHVAADLAWLYQTGLAVRVQALAQKGTTVLGICGGLQMLGHEVRDPKGVESSGSFPGLGLLDVETELATSKVTQQVETNWLPAGERLLGYEIHHGRTRPGPRARALLEDGLGYEQEGVLGVYLHGLFDNDAFRRDFLNRIGVEAIHRDWREHVDDALDRLAKHLEATLNMDALDKVLGSTTSRGSNSSSSRLYLITGGVRSGKSRYAEALAHAIGRERVTYIATLSADDEEMKDRVARHRARRPATWVTVEASLDVAEAVRHADTKVVLLDCLSGFVSNLLLQQDNAADERAERAVLAAIAELLRSIREAAKTVVVVSNEVGNGVVPPYPLGRRYRDLLGLANQRVASTADAVSLLTVGIPQTLKGTFPEVQLDARHDP